MIGVHKLILLGFYDFLISYLTPHQRDVTMILAYLAQSSHELVPPDALETVIRAIADNFIWSNCASEVITAGLNGLREICVRCPLAMPEELLKSLMEDYKNHREKGPMNAARSLLGLYREINPSLLKKRDRGKSASISMANFKEVKYGQVDVYDTVDGAELLSGNKNDEEAPELVSSQICDNQSDSADSLSVIEELEEEELEINSEYSEDFTENEDNDAEEGEAEITTSPMTAINPATEKVCLKLTIDFH